MKTWVLIEADTKMYSLTAWGVVREKDGRFAIDSTSLCLVKSDRPVLFGQVSSLLASRETVEEAKPMELAEVGPEDRREVKV
jgi:hypothetical protein